MSNEHDDVLEAASRGSQGPADESAQREDSMLTMDELMAQYEAAEPLQELREGEVVQGTVVQITEQCAMIDVGTKSEGMIPKGELDLIRDDLKVGDKILVYVARIEDEEGNLIVSKRQADYEQAWEDIVGKEDTQEILEAQVIEAVKGGLLVDLGVYGQGFVPASHVSVRRPRNLQKYVGQTLKLQVIEVERKRKRVVLSHRVVVEQERAAERDDTIKTLREGQVRRGLVRRITDFGAFVDIGGVDGLLHVSEMSWNRISDPGEMLRVGDETEVMVLKLNLDEGRISLGLRQLQSDPWREIPKIYREGQVLRARIVKSLVDSVVVRLPVGLDALVLIPEELRPAAAAAEPVAEVTESEAAPAEVVADAPVDGAPEAVADVVAEGAPEAEAEVAAEAPAEAAEVVAEAADVVAEAAAPAVVEEAVDRFAVGVEIELRVERLIPVERELELRPASQASAAEQRAAADAERPRSSGTRAPLARGRYSDRVRDEDDDSGSGEARSQPSQRRDRRRDRDRDDDRDREFQVADQAPLARRTLGDLMGDKLRSLLGDPEAATETSEATEEAADNASN